MKLIIISLLLIYVSMTAKSQNNLPEVLGVPIKVPNIVWLIHPWTDPANNNLYPYYLKKTNGDIVSVLVDLKNVTDVAVPTSRFSLITVNTTSDTYKYINFLPEANVTPPVTFGKFWNRFEGPDKKLYLSTIDGGGELLQYDIDNETGKDLGSPFTITNGNNSTTYGIYSLSIGSDSAIYGGSFGYSDGATYTFRYDPKTNTFWKYLTPIASDLQYVSYVGGDANCNYVVCGQSTWRVYSVERNTNTVKLLLSSNNRIYGFNNTPCGVYTKVDGVSYKLSATVATAEEPSVNCNTIDFVIPPTNADLPETIWNPVSSTYYYKPQNGIVKQIMFDSVKLYPQKINLLSKYKDSLVVGSGPSYSYTLDYNPQSTNPPKLIGDNTDVSIHGMLEYNNKIYIGGYPSGILEEWDPSKSWTHGSYTLSYTPPPFNSVTSNARKLTNFRVDGYGIHELLMVGATNNGYIVVTGNNIRTDTSICFGSYKNGDTMQLKNSQRFRNYSISGHCLSFLKNTAFVLAKNKDNWQNLLFEYNPQLNNIIDSFPLFTSPISDLGPITILPTEELFGTYIDVNQNRFMYTYDLKEKKITWQENILGATDFFRVGPDRQVWFTTYPNGAVFAKFNKFNPYTRKISDGPIINKSVESLPDYDPFITDILFWDKDIYLGGYYNLLRIKDAVEPVPIGLTPEEEIQWIFNKYKKVNTICN